MIDKDLDDGAVGGDKLEEHVVPNPNFDPAARGHPDSAQQPFEAANSGWSIVGIARTNGDEEELCELRPSHVTWRGS